MRSTNPRILTFTLALVSPLIAACEGPSTMEIWARSSISDPKGIEGIQLRLNGREFTADDFSDRGGLIEISARVPNEGDLLIEMELMQDGELVAEGSFTLGMSPRFEWGMDIFRQAEDPTLTCLGCLGKRTFGVAEEFANEPGEAIWFAWGGRRRGSGIVF